MLSTTSAPQRAASEICLFFLPHGAPCQLLQFCCIARTKLSDHPALDRLPKRPPPPRPGDSIKKAEAERGRVGSSASAKYVRVGGGVKANHTLQTRSRRHTSDLASSISACALNKSSAHTCTCNNAPLDTALIPLPSLVPLPLAPAPPPLASASAAPVEAAAAAAGEEASNSSRAR